MRGANIRGFSFKAKANYSIFLLLNASNTNILKKTGFRKQLIEWYFEHKRDLPWRETTDPYKIWLSEIILQQTRVAQGLPYYVKFAENYPTVKSLALAPEDDLMKHWEGLGYYSRARNLQSAAKYIMDDLNGVFPSDYLAILKLKGVGDYTASAISSFAFNEVQAVLDGNVFRVLARLHNIDTPINSSDGIKIFKKLASDLISKNNPATYNQAIMEFGALQCVPKNPNCDHCIFNISCAAKRLGKVDMLPVKLKKTYRKERYFHFFVLKSSKGLLVERREGKDIWKNLYQFPMIELPQTEDLNMLINGNELPAVLDHQYFTLEKVVDLKAHLLSHQSLHIRIFEMTTEELKCKSHQKWFEIKDLGQLAFPKPLREYLDINQLTLPF